MLPTRCTSNIHGQQNPSAQSANKHPPFDSLLQTARGDSIQELAFLDLKYEVENIRPGMEAETLKVLEGVSGQANSGEMLALVRVLEQPPAPYNQSQHGFRHVLVFYFLLPCSVRICPASPYFL